MARRRTRVRRHPLMAWLVLALCIAAAAGLIALPRTEERRDNGAAPALVAEREQLLAELRELDDDQAAGRISVEDRLAGRRAVAPRLRAVTEALRERGV